MNERIDKVEKEIAALEEQHKELTLKKELNDSERYDLEQIPSKLADRRDYRKTLITALATATAPTQGT
jgi:hypothetical protein